MKQYELRYYQKNIVDLCLNNTGRDICVCAPTAAGKSVIAYDLATKLPGRVAIITYANELVRQFLQDFSIPHLVGKTHYETKKDYENAKERVANEKICIMNPISYLHYMQEKNNSFDSVIWDEADACLGLLQLADGDTYDFPYEYVSYETIKAVLLDAGNNVEYVQWVINNLFKFWWEVTEVVKKGTIEKKFHLRPLILSNKIRNIVKAPTNILMSGTLLPSTCQEFLGHDDYIYREIPSIIPIENRRIHQFTDESFSNTLEGQAEMLKAVLSKFKARPAIVHTTYQEAKLLQEFIKSDDIIAYSDPAEKLITLNNAEKTLNVVLAGGATTGLNLAYDKCRLNIILRGAFANLCDNFVRRRKSLEGGTQWYEQVVLRHFVQACGRSTRSPDDYSEIVVTDNRLISLAYRNKHLLPEYFKESFIRGDYDLR